MLLVLIGDYPDHRKRKPGRKADGHYKLDRLRSGHWTQTPDERLKTLLAAGVAGLPELSQSPREVLNEFRQQYGFRPGYREFLDWYRQNYPQDYAAVFR